MEDPYRLADTSEILSPSLLVFCDQLESNLDEMVRIAGDVSRLRPHCKTHKIREVAAAQVARGITRHKCATFAEAEMLASAGATDVLLAYGLVGPNISRAVQLVATFPEIRFSVTADHAGPVAELGAAMTNAGLTIDVLLDIDSGQARTGVPVGESAMKLYAGIAATAGLRAGGLHLYDGQNHQTDLDERRAAVVRVWEDTRKFRDTLVADGMAVPRIVAGGTGSFPLFAEFDDPALELSPGTVVFFDAGYAAMFPDLSFRPAAVILTRVVSRPTAQRITLDVGYKACASDPPAGKRLIFPQLSQAREVLHNEEHLVLESDEAARYQPGDALIAIPWHICPTTALHDRVSVIRNGRVAETWDVAARGRVISV